MPNPKTAVFPTAVLFYTVNAADAAVDYDASHLWIMGFALWISGLESGERRCGQAMQGDVAPCGTTHRDAAAPLLLAHALRE